MLKFVLVLIAATATSLPCWSSDSVGTSAPLDTIRITIPRYPYTGDWGAMATVDLTDTTKNQGGDDEWCGWCLLNLWCLVHEARLTAAGTLTDEAISAYSQAEDERKVFYRHIGEPGYGLDSRHFWLFAYAEKVDSSARALLDELDSDTATLLQIIAARDSGKPVVIVAESDSATTDDPQLLANRIIDRCYSSVDASWAAAGLGN